MGSERDWLGGEGGGGEGVQCSNLYTSAEDTRGEILIQDR